MFFISTMKAWRNILWTVSVCVLYVATAKLGLEYAVVGNTVTLLWPPSGIALAATLLGGYRVWVGIALGAILAKTGTGIPVLSLAYRPGQYPGTFVRRLVAQTSEGLFDGTGQGLRCLLFHSVRSPSQHRRERHARHAGAIGRRGNHDQPCRDDLVGLVAWRRDGRPRDKPVFPYCQAPPDSRLPHLGIVYENPGSPDPGHLFDADRPGDLRQPEVGR